MRGRGIRPGLRFWLKLCIDMACNTIEKTGWVDKFETFGREAFRAVSGWGKCPVKDPEIQEQGHLGTCSS